MELPWNNVLGLVGLKTPAVDENTQHRILSTHGSNLYFPLPKDEFGNLTLEQVKEKVMKALIEFSGSDKFKNSFLARVQSVDTNIKGKMWPK